VSTPRMNHFWNVAFQITARGLATPLLKTGDRTFTIAFDFVDHQLVIHSSTGMTETIPLQPRTVAEFYMVVMDTLGRMGLGVKIWPVQVEVSNPVRLDKDVAHHSYDAHAANAYWRILVATKPVFEDFRCRFLGKCSPVHFFWGSFDLASTRFSGRRAPERPGADRVTQEAYSHEVISAGFWAGSGAVQEAAFYAYAAPEPAGLRELAAKPSAVSYQKEMGIFILPYAAVRTASSPVEALMAFLQSTYDAAADLAKWD